MNVLKLLWSTIIHRIDSLKYNYRKIHHIHLDVSILSQGVNYVSKSQCVTLDQIIFIQVNPQRGRKVLASIFTLRNVSWLNIIIIIEITWAAPENVVQFIKKASDFSPRFVIYDLGKFEHSECFSQLQLRFTIW